MAGVLNDGNQDLHLKLKNNNVTLFFINHQLILYFITTFSLSWICWSWIQVPEEISEFVLDRFWFITQIGVLVPSMVAILFSYLFERQVSLQRFVKLISIYLGLIFIGYLISIFQVTDLAQLPTLLKITIIVSAVLILWFFLSQKKVLYTSQSKGFLRWRNFSYIISSWLFYPLLFLVTWFFYHLVTGSPSIDICKNVNLSLISILSLTITFDFLFGGSVGEEIGWRGYALPLLLKSYTPVTASIILGVIWSLWHLPIDLLAGFGVQGVTGIILRCLTVCPMSVIITWFYLHSKYGMMTSLLLHSGINIIPAFGFSNYEVVFGILIILQMIIVFMILLSDKKIWERHYN